MAAKIKDAAATLNEITHELPDGTKKAHKVHQIEHMGDEVTRQIYEHLDESLITPLEPEEISRLAPVRDDVLDTLDGVSHQIATYELSQSNDVLKEYSSLIVMTGEEISGAIDALSTLSKPDEVRSRVSEVNRLYNLSGELPARAVLDLFKAKDLLLIIKLKDIYESMAKVMEKCNDVGHALSDISMNHT
ncbi:MAG: DUF47 family protein [Methanoregula sp.]|jgi:hypothetical protein